MFAAMKSGDGKKGLSNEELAARAVQAERLNFRSPVAKHKPYVAKTKTGIAAFCPLCAQKVYESEKVDNGELACGIALGLHLPSCKENPDRVESDMDKLLRRIRGEE